MLAAAKRKLNPRTTTSKHLDAAFQQLYLPWLCPAQIRRTASLTPNAPPRELVRHHPRQLATRTTSRSLATATDFFNTPGSNDHVPFLANNYTPNSSSSRASEMPFSMIRPWSSSPIVIHDAIAVPPTILRKNRFGIGGDGAELLSNLHTCLSVGRFQRAEAIIRRMAQLYSPVASELRVAHNLYLRSLLDSLMLGRENASVKKIHHWFEVEMRQTGVNPDSTTFAILCRTAMATLSGNTRDRTIRRHLHQAEEAGLLGDTIASGEFYEDEWEELLRIRDLHTPAEIEATKIELAEPDKAAAAPLSTGPYQPIDLEVTSVLQKGMGLASLKGSVSSLYDFDPTTVKSRADGEQTQEETDRAILHARQIHVEEAVVDATLSRWKDEHAQMLKMGINTNLQTRSLGAMMWEWHMGLETMIKKEVKEIQALLDKADSGEAPEDLRTELGPYLEAVRPEKMAAITIMTVFQYLAGEGAEVGMTLSRLTGRLGRNLEAECSVRSHVSRKRHDDRVNSAHHRSLFLARLTEQSGKAEPGAVESKTRRNDIYDRWPLAIRHRLAALLLSKMIDGSKIAFQVDSKKQGGKSHRKESAFRHSIDSIKGKRVGMIHAHIELVKIMGRVPSRSALGLSGHLPMLTPPQPWTGFKQGGYLRYPAKFMRSKGGDPTQEMYAVAAIDKGDMDQVFAGLDVLGKTAWKINTPILKIMVEAWNSGEALADIPPLNPDMPYPPEPESSADGKTRYKWRQQIQAIENEKMGLHSQRCFQNLQLEVAKAFANETFYYPHNIDFRGRAYPIPPFLNHMGADGSRGLLHFAKGRALGPGGLRWLKIQLANVFGNNKSTLAEREQFATDHLDDIYDSVTNPLKGKRWWSTAEDPWQSLACCFEIKAALDSGDPENFVSHLAVHQDGTCNGLQHYAALGGDKLGATQVNLEPGDRPADIYSGVADLVRSSIQADAKEGNALGLALQDKVTRKLVKQTVMTNVYGVTFIGARAQVQKQLDDMMPSQSQTPIENHILASYVAKKIFKALAAMFQGAHAIQYWLGECADRISTTVTPEQLALIKAKKDGVTITDPQYTKSALTNMRFRKNAPQITDFKSSVVWTTPLKLPVVQPYRAQRKREIQTTMQNITLRESKPGDPVSKRKQLQAFPPNFVHSLDATHMLLSALKCDELGLTFAAVHDSFWTHAADVDVMNGVLRDSFVRMHEEDIIGRLEAEFKVRYKDSIRLTSVYTQSAIGQQIHKWRSGRGTLESKAKKVGGSFTNELLEEWERQKLLSSADPEEVAKGKAMVTPASIFESVDDATQFQPPTEGLETLSPDGTTNVEALENALNDEMPDLEGTEIRTDVVEELNAESEGLGMAQKIAKRSKQMSKKTKTSEQRKNEMRLHIWVPLTFPELPKRGDFDVSRVRDSTYFFS